MDFDYVVIVSDGDLELLPAHIESIRATEGPSLVHIVDKTISGIGEMEFPIETKILHVLRHPARSLLPVPDCGYDVADAYHKALEQCGDKQFCMISHTDVTYKNVYIWRRIAECSASHCVIGDCRSVLFMDRAAYAAAHFGFWPLRELYGERIPNSNGIWLRGKGQPVQQERVVVDGLDVGDLMFLELRMLGYAFKTHGDFWSDCILHPGGSSTLPVQ